MSSEDLTDMESPKISKYNSAISQLMRIDYLWQDAHRHSRTGMLKQWNWDLDRIWCELASDCDAKDEEAVEEFNIEISKIDDQRAMYKMLMQKEIKLRRLQNKQGKGTAYEEGLDEYMNG